MNAVYWKGGVCGFERQRQSSIRIEALPPEDETFYGLRIRLRTQRGRAKELLEEAARWIRELARLSGCQIPDAEEIVTKHHKVRALSEEMASDEKRTQTKEPDFGPLPRTTQKTYCVSYAWTKESSGFVDKLCKDAATEGIEVIETRPI
jgi:hypothetical protein